MLDLGGWEGVWDTVLAVRAWAQDRGFASKGLSPLLLPRLAGPALQAARHSPALEGQGQADCSGDSSELATSTGVCSMLGLQRSSPTPPPLQQQPSEGAPAPTSRGPPAQR